MSVPRVLTDVDVFSGGAPGTCQVRDALSTPYDGTFAANGALFTVSALGSLDILAIEFATNIEITDENIDMSSLPQVQVWARQGTTFSDKPSDWIELANTRAVVSPDRSGVLVPRVEMSQPISLTAGADWSILVSLEGGDEKILRMKGVTDTVGMPFQENDLVKLNVGRSLDSPGDPFQAPRSASMAFQGKLHYRSLKPCSSMTSTTKLPFSFVVKAGAGQSEVQSTVFAIFSTMLRDEANFKRLAQVHNLKLQDVDIGERQAADKCDEYGFEIDGCDQYFSQVLFDHYSSLHDHELILELLQDVQFRDDLGADGSVDDINVVYTGDEVLEESYEVSVVGVPPETYLNPFQRDYLSEVIYDFLKETSGVLPYKVEVAQSLRRNLVRKRELQGQLTALATIVGIGDDADGFWKEIKSTFDKQKDELIHRIRQEQYLPGPINDGNDFGAIFRDISNIKIAPQRLGNLGPAVGNGGDDGMSKAQIQIISFSIAAVLAFLWLLYRFMRDCVLVEKGFKVENKKLSDVKTANSDGTFTRPELENMDKPRQKPTSSIDIPPLPEIKISSDKKDEDPSSSMDSSIRRGRRPPNKRGVNRSRSSDDTDLLSIESDEPYVRRQSDPLEAAHLNLSLRGSNRTALETVSEHQATESCRNGDSLPKGSNSSHRKGRPPPSKRGVAKSNTFNGYTRKRDVKPQSPRRRESFKVENDARTTTNGESISGEGVKKKKKKKKVKSKAAVMNSDSPSKSKPKAKKAKRSSHPSPGPKKSGKKSEAKRRPSTKRVDMAGTTT